MKFKPTDLDFFFGELRRPDDMVILTAQEMAHEILVEHGVTDVEKFYEGIEAAYRKHKFLKFFVHPTKDCAIWHNAWLQAHKVMVHHCPLLHKRINFMIPKGWFANHMFSG